MNIYLYTNGASKGPYPFSQIESMRRRGNIVADALYCIEGTEDWRSVSELPAAPAKQGFFLTYILPMIFLGLVAIAAGLFIVVVHQIQAQQAEQARQAAAVPTSGLLDAKTHIVTAKEIEEGMKQQKRILTFRQTAHDSMCHVFTTHHLTPNMQGLLDMDYYITTSQKRGAELGSKSGLVATRAILESLAVDWPEGGRPTTLDETISAIQTYTVVYTIYWQAAEGTAMGFYKFEHRLNLQTGETLSVRLLQTGDFGR